MTATDLERNFATESGFWHASLENIKVAQVKAA